MYFLKMKEFGIFIFGILALVGLCAIAGFATRGTNGMEDRDDVRLTLLRGLAVVMGLFTILGLIGGIICLFVDF